MIRRSFAIIRILSRTEETLSVEWFSDHSRTNPIVGVLSECPFFVPSGCGDCCEFAVIDGVAADAMLAMRACTLEVRKRAVLCNASPSRTVSSMMFHLSLRASQGFLESVVKLMGVDLPIPDYTTVSRRQAGLALQLGPSRTRRRVTS